MRPSKRGRDDEAGEGALEGAHPIVALGLAGVSRVGCDSPACGVVCDSALFRCVAELAVERRPVVYRGTEIFCLSTDPSHPHISLGTPDIESCADGYDVGERRRGRDSKARPLGYRGLRFWALVGVYYRDRSDGAEGPCDVPESALFALVSWNTVNGDVVSKTLLLRGSEAYSNQMGRCAAAWDWPLVAFTSSEDVIYVASAATGEILHKCCARVRAWDSSYRIRALFLCDVKADDGHVKKCVGTARARQLEWRPLEDVDHVLLRLPWCTHMYFAHPQAVFCAVKDMTVLYDVRSGQKLAQCVTNLCIRGEFVAFSRLWTLGELLQLVEKNLDPSLVEFESGFYVQFRGGSAARAIPNGLQGNLAKYRFFKRYLCDFHKLCLTHNFQSRGWVPAAAPAGVGASGGTGEEDPQSPNALLETVEWDVCWANKDTVRALRSSRCRLGDRQMINHWLTFGEITRKDNMMRNIKAHRRELAARGDPLGEVDASTGRFVQYDIIPQTFILPREHALFAEDFRRNPQDTWICKPAAGSRGVGIFLVRDLKDVAKWSVAGAHGVFISCEPPAEQTEVAAQDDGSTEEDPGAVETMVISRYVSNPLLIGGRKFDLRIYVLVVSWRPLVAMMHRHGFARFCSVRYDSVGCGGCGQEGTLYGHLTNVAQQVGSSTYNASHGGKWPLNNLLLFLEGTRGRAVADKCLADIRKTIVLALQAVQGKMLQDPHCFEMYGYDILLDTNLKPWLIEINASPSLTSTTPADLALKTGLIDDVLRIVIPSGTLSDLNVREPGRLARSIRQVPSTNFDVIVNELSAEPPLQSRSLKSRR